MFGQIELFELTQGVAKHASARQARIAANVANADTAGYRATDIQPFMETYRPSGTGSAMKATRAGHFSFGHASGAHGSSLGNSKTSFEAVDRPSGASPNGNTVSVEMEMLHAIDADRAHNRAVTVYQTTLGILRTSVQTSR